MDKLYGGITEDKWKERIYRAWRWSSTPTETLWDLFKPLLEDHQHKQPEIRERYDQADDALSLIAGNSTKNHSLE